ncbi:RNA binding methyltransferase FtsJ like [hydrothermal vent metagenome]|uniref:RNA binding methyltransferase FtsJ like n=1 Tax=hydrothermal vent metagenome TaxID=652676 RepID=A0A3B1DZ50_9ZZZZ
MPAEPDCPFVSRGGLKLRHALDVFAIDPAGLVCADLGCSTGGFTDCLLQAGASRVFCVDTAYGQFAWKLRTDSRVVLLERANAMHTEPPSEVGEGVGLVVIDLGWTRQDKAIPAALRWLGKDGCIVSLIKPHYEQPLVPRARMGKGKSKSPPMEDEEAERVVERVVEQMPGLGVRVAGLTTSPIRGGKAGKGAAKGNVEFLAMLQRCTK